MTADEVAEVFGMSRDWVYERALAGDLPSYKLPGGKRRFLYSELLEARCGGSAKDLRTTRRDWEGDSGIDSEVQDSEGRPEI
jgi:excisionase family DNA binding protein